jgi:DNA-directed RNA polymerase subunit M/transcription elongation factor TFIIS
MYCNMSSDEESSYYSSSDDETIVSVSKSSRLQITNNRVKNYEKFDIDWEWLGVPQVAQKREVMARVYNTINGGDDDIWENQNFKTISMEFDKENETIKNPFPVSECSEPCPKCSSERTLVYSKQTRSADEGTTIFIYCGDCGKTSRS